MKKQSNRAKSAPKKSAPKPAPRPRNLSAGAQRYERENALVDQLLDAEADMSGRWGR